jgi:formylglycine-generating enzyme required for sulfatase activity
MRLAVSGDRRPVDTVNWFEPLAAANAASDADGLARCYTLTGCSGSVGAGMTCTDVAVTAASGSVYDCEGWRLPTEAEWEHAARGGESYAYAGSNTLGDVGWYGDDYVVTGNLGNSGGETHEVCELAANGYGLCDMSGNVTEWTWDLFDYLGRDAEDPEGAASGFDRVRRGCSWGTDLKWGRVSYRSFFTPFDRSALNGFRLVRTAP